MISVYVQKTLATAKSDTPLTSGSVGTVVQFYFSSDWEGLNRTAVFETSAHQKETVELNEDNSAVIPESVMAQDGVTLFIGVYGTNEGGSIVVPTVYANCGEIKTGANTEPGGEPVTPSQAQQLQNQIDDLDDRVDALEAGGGGSGGGAVTSVNGQTGAVVLNATDVGALPDTTPIPTVPTNVSAFTNDAGYAKTSEIPAVPSALPNPNKLTFTGAVSAEYDGSEAVNVEIPQGGGGSGWTLLTEATTQEVVAYTAVEIPGDATELFVRITIPGNTEGLTNNVYAKAWSNVTPLSGGAGEVSLGALATSEYYYKAIFRKLGNKTDAWISLAHIYAVNATAQKYGGKWDDVKGNYFVVSTQYGNDYLPIGTNIVIYGR